MILVEKALDIVLDHTPRLATEEVDFQEVCGRVLAEDVRSDTDLPPFARSIVDGYALRADDTSRVPARMNLVGAIPAGIYPSFRIEAGQAAYITTGAPVPEGADAVQMVEHTRLGVDEVEILEPVAAGENVVPRGSEVKAGELVLKKGTRLDAASVAVAASVGKTRLAVGRRPRVAIVATGDELVSPFEKPRPGQIRNSNGFALSAQARAAGAEVAYLGVAADNEDSLCGLIREGLTRDVVLVSGGVSVGRFDLVEKVLHSFHVELWFDAVAVKPGKPLVFGTGREGNLVFGLPGNPVSTMVTFELFVRPALAKMEGSERFRHPHLPAILKGPVSSRGPRRAYLPGWLEPSPGGGLPLAHPIPTRGSGDIVAFSKANALLILPEGKEQLEAGETVRVYPLDSYLYREDRWHEERPS